MIKITPIYSKFIGYSYIIAAVLQIITSVVYLSIDDYFLSLITIIPCFLFFICAFIEFKYPIPKDFIIEEK